jgi:hypothetical protein
MTVYKMVQIPPNIQNLPKSTFAQTPDPSQVAAAYLEKVVSEWATQGWDFHRVDALGVTSHPGCLTFGRPTTDLYYVITFKQER